MIKTILFDVDGIVIRREMYFSQVLQRDFNIPRETVMPFFDNEFKLCKTGQLDLKQELEKRIQQWGWTKSVDDLLDYWFSHESTTDPEVLQNIGELKSKNIACYLQTRNEKYRANYLWETVGLNKFFDGMFASCDLGYSKPDPGFWNEIHQKLGQPEKSEILLWDNDQDNVDSAGQFGFQAELYTAFPAYETRMKELVG